MLGPCVPSVLLPPQLPREWTQQAWQFQNCNPQCLRGQIICILALRTIDSCELSGSRYQTSNSLHNRASLLPQTYSTPPSSGRSSPYGQLPSGQRYADDLEGQNDEHLEGLAAKVKMLKDVSNSMVYGSVQCLTSHILCRYRLRLE